MARHMRFYPSREFISHRFKDVEDEQAVHKVIAPDSIKVVFDPWA